MTINFFTFQPSPRGRSGDAGASQSRCQGAWPSLLRDQRSYLLRSQPGFTFCLQYLANAAENSSIIIYYF